MVEASLDSSLKSREVEEVIDLAFYRPLGFLIARALSGSNVHPNQVTVASILLGVLSGHLLYYDHLGLTLAGILTFVAATLLDSVDGQLARLKRLQSPFGRMLDGIAGACMFTSIYLHLALRQYAAGDGVLVIGVAFLALYSQAVQNSVADSLLNAYLTYAVRKGEFELDDAGDIRDRMIRSPSQAEKWGLWLYASFTATQAWLMPALYQFRRAMRTEASENNREQIAAAYRRLNRAIVQQRAWIATNIRMAILFAAILTDTVVWFFWFNIVVLNLVTVGLVVFHERNCRRLSDLLSGGASHSEVRSL